MTRTAAIVCGAGVSSTFLARAVRTLATERGLDWRIEPLAEDQVPTRIDELSIVLVGHHLADRFEALQRALALSGVPAALLPEGDPVTTAEHGVALLLALDSARTVSEGHPHG
ncbi:PTS sugar transporter subunit IIB [Microcella sp.]|uniref:PTS sugar transporter subunit IIB n=1 Tax=Microcella sp. TaxID=1913979 RepID=UPI003918A31D